MIRLRAFRKTDPRTVKTLVERILKEHGLYRDHLPSLAGLADIAATYRPPRGCFLVALKGRDIVGCGGLRPSKSGWAEVNRMYVDRRIRGQGLGRRILDHLVAHARKKRFTRLFLESSTRFERAIRLYASSGFSGRVIDTGNCCNIRMRKTL